MIEIMPLQLYLDEIIGKIKSNLISYNIWDDTFIFFSTDNGGMPYWSTTNGNMVVSYGCNEPLRAGKATLFEGIYIYIYILYVYLEYL